MTAVYLTTMGKLWGGWGININAVEVGPNGWVYLAGIDQKNGNGLIVMGYHDGQLAWSKKFHDEKFGQFEALSFKNGSIYAAGQISTNFNGADLSVNGGPPVVAPQKAPLDPKLAALYPDQFNDTTYPIYVKLNAETGELQQANVLASPNVQGRDRLSSIAVDDNGNVYVAGGGWNPGPNPLDSFKDGQFYFFTHKFDPSGQEVWKIDGDSVAIDPNTGIPAIARYQELIVNLNPLTGQDAQTINNGLHYVPNSVSHYNRGWVYDTDGNIYFLAARTFWDETKSQWSDQHGVLVKIDHATGQVAWTTPFGQDADFCMPNSVTLDEAGNVIIGGEVTGKMNGKGGFGASDGFLLTIDHNSGQILKTDIIGTGLNEGISQVKYQPIFDGQGNIVDYNMIIGGSFEVARYSLEGRSEKDLYIITNESFQLLGNALDNIIQAGGGNDSIDGGIGNDSLIGGAGADTLLGGTGNDELYSGDGNDSVNAGIGNDLIVAGDGKGNDTYNGGDGVDTIKYTSATASITVNVATGSAKSTTGTDTASIGTDKFSNIENVTAGNYSDLITGSDAANKIEAGTGADTIIGGKGADNLLGQGGDDLFLLSSLSDFVIGVNGETITGGEGTDELRVAATSPGTLTLSSNVTVEKIVIGTGTGATAITTGTAAINVDASAVGSAVQMLGNAGANNLIGGAYNDSLDGGGGNDTLTGGAGNDTLNGNSGADTASYATATENLTLSLAIASGQSVGALGTDTLIGIENLLTGSGNDSLTGDGNANILNGGVGNDSLFGGAGADTLLGGDGRDTLYSGLGNDVLTGGIGSDTFVFDSTPNSTTNRDTVSDFKSGDDKIGFSKAIFVAFSSLSVGATIAAEQFWGGAGVTKAHDADDRIIYNKTTGALFYDADGSGSGAAVQIAILSTKPSLASSDFVVF